MQWLAKELAAIHNGFASAASLGVQAGHMALWIFGRSQGLDYTHSSTVVGEGDGFHGERSDIRLLSALHP